MTPFFTKLRQNGRISTIKMMLSFSAFGLLLSWLHKPPHIEASDGFPTTD